MEERGGGREEVETLVYAGSFTVKSVSGVEMRKRREGEKEEGCACVNGILLFIDFCYLFSSSLHSFGSHRSLLPVTYPVHSTLLWG